MKSVFTLLCIISAAHYATAQCSAIRTFTEQLQPACDPNDVYIKWPNYADQTKYYSCYGVANPVLTPCPSGEYFCYVYQKCVACGDYIPPVKCQNLKTQNPPKCVSIGSTATVATSTSVPPTTPLVAYPTPNYPSTSATPLTVPQEVTTSPATTASAATTASSSYSVTTPVGPPGPPTPPTVTKTPTSPKPTFPGPPSPVTSNPNVPMPPTPAPTPPNINEQPPTVASG